MREHLRRILLIVFAGIFLVSAFYIGKYYWESHVQQGKYNDLANLVHGAQGYLTEPTRPPKETTGATEGTTPEGSETMPEETEPLPMHVPVEDPKTHETLMVLREYAEVYQMNRDFIGWLHIEDTIIDYPVVYRPKNRNYYLRRSFEGKSSTRGCLYIREECDPVTPSDNGTIYGHRMRDGTMFADLAKFMDKKFFETHQTFTFDTLFEHHTYQIVTVFLTTAYAVDSYPYHLFTNAVSEADFDDFINTCKSMQFYDTGVSAVWGDKLITLSTCDKSIENGRLVVIAKRIA